MKIIEIIEKQQRAYSMIEHINKCSESIDCNEAIADEVINICNDLINVLDLMEVSL